MMWQVNTARTATDSNISKPTSVGLNTGSTYPRSVGRLLQGRGKDPG
jgi:hypothetical protein